MRIAKKLLKLKTMHELQYAAVPQGFIVGSEEMLSLAESLNLMRAKPLDTVELVTELYGIPVYMVPFPACSIIFPEEDARIFLQEEIDDA